jgi:hypothetical protein
MFRHCAHPERTQCTLSDTSSVDIAAGVGEASQYNFGVNRIPLYLLTAALLLAGCNRAPESKEAVRSAVMDHLAKNTGLDVNSMTIDVGDVKFEGDKALAIVSFRPKSSPDAGMTMNYTLERHGAKWIVAKRPESGGHGAEAQPPAAQSGGEMPAGHPPVGGSQKGASDLPPGHPPVSQPGAAKK